MSTFPHDLQPADGRQRTEIICPECGGSITVQAIGSGRVLAFRCRVGHAFTLEDMIVGKEAHIESLMWQMLHAYEEFAALLKDVGDPTNQLKSLPDHERVRRIRQVEENADELKRVIERDEPIKLAAPDGRREPQ